MREYVVSEPVVAIECGHSDDLFSEAWAERLLQAWNADGALVSALGGIGFTARVAFGLIDEEAPRCRFLIERGRLAPADSVDCTPDWDVRATPEQWAEWMIAPPGLLSLGMAYASGSLQFRHGDYITMIKDPAMAGPFVKCIELMSRSCRQGP